MRYFVALLILFFSLIIVSQETYGADDFLASLFGKRQQKAAAKPSPKVRDEKKVARSLIPQDVDRTHIPEKRPDNCEPLKAMGCIHMEGKCAKEHVTSEGFRICLEYEHKYKCPVSTSYSQRGVKGLPAGYCMTGDCLKTTRSSNKNMLDALSKLEALKQIQKHQQKNPISIFAGEAKSCTTNFGGSFKDCCGGMDGFGLSMKLSTQCTAEEQSLVHARGKNQCIFIGPIKKNNHLGINFSKQYVYCCFSTKLSRIFQEQGRRQLGLSFGTPENPNCRGLTINELQRIDMGKINFQEVFVEIAESISKATAHLKQSMAQKQKAFSQDNAQNLQKQKQESMFSKAKQSTPQTLERSAHEEISY